jgi:fibronectin-binding autotransporter adhesin
MATRTVSNAGGNWNATTSWVGGVVPIAGDNVDFTATSGNITVNVSTANLIGITFANYVGTITFNNVINTSGTVNLGTGGYTQAGASGINLVGTATLTSGGVTWSRTLTFTGTSITYTLSANWMNTGTVTFGGTTTTIINGNTLNIGGNLTSNTTAIVSGTTTIVFNGTGTWSNSSTGAIRNNLTINTAGTLTISGNVYYNTGTLTYTAGTVVTTGSTLNISVSTTLTTNGVSWNNISTSTSLTITLGSNLTLTGTLTVGTTGVATLSFVLGGFNIISSSANLSVANSNTFTVPQNLTFVNVTVDSAVTLNGNQITATGNLTHVGSSTVLGTTSMILSGTGTWNHTSTGVIRNNLTINTIGTITLGTNVYYNTGTLTYTAGTVVTAGSTLNISTNTTLTTNGITWNNIKTSGSVVITLGSNLTLTGTLTVTTALSFILGGNSLISINANLFLDNGSFTLPTNQTFKSLSTGNLTAAINSNTLTLTENITLAAPTSGTANIVYTGTGTWTASSSAQIINNNFTINTVGTLTISGIVYKGTNTFIYTAGTIVDTGATVVVGSTTGGTTCNVAGKTWEKLLIRGGVITLTSNINAVTFGTTSNTAISFTLGGNTLNFTHLELGNTGITTLPTAWVCQNIEFILGGTLNSNSITINGNILQSGSGALSGTTTFTYAGTGSWTATGTAYCSNSFTINTAGTLTIISANIGGGIFTYTAGTVITTGSTLNIRQSGTTLNGAIVWYNVTTPTNVTSLVLNNQLVCLNALTIDNSQVTFSGTDGTFDVYYLNLNSSGTVARNPRLVATKTYRVRAGFTSQGTLAFPITLSSTVGGSKAIFTVDPGTTIDVGFVNATDINSLGGKKIYSYRGVFSNTDNWEILPTDPIFSSSSTFII